MSPQIFILGIQGFTGFSEFLEFVEVVTFNESVGLNVKKLAKLGLPVFCSHKAFTNEDSTDVI